MRVVLDTNTVVSALLFEKGRLAWLRAVWRTERLTPLASKATTEELIRVLSYPKFVLSPSEIEDLLADYLPYVEVVAVDGGWPSDLPHCRDADDDVFLALAAQAGADILVTGDQALLELEGLVPFAIQKPSAFRKRFGL